MEKIQKEVVKLAKKKVMFSMSEELQEQIEEFAKEMGTSRSGVVEWVMRNYFTSKQRMMEKVTDNQNLMSQIKEILTQLHDVNVGESDESA